MNSPLSWNRKGKRQKASPLFVNEKTMRSRWEFPPMAGFGSDLHTSVMGNPNIFQEYVRNLIWMQCITCYPMHWKHQCIEPFVNTSSIVEGSQAKTNPRHELLQPGGRATSGRKHLFVSITSECVNIKLIHETKWRERGRGILPKMGQLSRRQVWVAFGCQVVRRTRGLVATCTYV